MYPSFISDISRSIDIFDADMKASANEAKTFFEGITAGVIVTGNETINYFVDVVVDVHVINADGLNSSQIADDIASNIRKPIFLFANLRHKKYKNREHFINSRKFY